MKTYFGTCTTNANVATKIVELQNGETGVTFNENFLLSVYFHANNTINNELKINLKLYGSNTYINSEAITIRNTLQEFASGSSNQDKRGDLTSWPAGTVVSFIYTQDAFYITNYRPITNISGVLSDYVSKTGFRAAAEDSNNGLITTAYDTGNIPESAKIVTRGANAFYTRPISQLIPYVHESAKVGFNGTYKTDGTNDTVKDPMIDIDNSDYNWFLVAETKINYKHIDKEIVFYVHDGQSGAKRGILEARVRSLDYGDTVSLSLNWDYCTYDTAELEDFQLITDASETTKNNSSGMDIICQLYTRVKTNWTPRIFTVITQGTRHTENSYSIYNTDPYYSGWKLFTWFKTADYSPNYAAMKSEHQAHRFKSPEAGLVATTDNTIDILFQSIQSKLNPIFIALNRDQGVSAPYVDFMDADNGYARNNWNPADGKNIWPGFHFYDNNREPYAGIYGTVNGAGYEVSNQRRYYSGISLYAQNYNNSNGTLIKTNQPYISIEAYKNNTSAIFLNASNIYTSITQPEINTLSVRGTSMEMYLWAANIFPEGNTTNTDYTGKVGLWCRRAEGGRRNLIQYTEVTNSNNQIITHDLVFGPWLSSNPQTTTDPLSQYPTITFYGKNFHVTRSGIEEKLFLNGERASIHFWADNSNTTSTFVNGAGIWYGYNNIGKRMIDYKIDTSNTDNGTLYIGQENDTIRFMGNNVRTSIDSNLNSWRVRSDNSEIYFWAGNDSSAEYKKRVGLWYRIGLDTSSYMNLLQYTYDPEQAKSTIELGTNNNYNLLIHGKIQNDQYLVNDAMLYFRAATADLTLEHNNLLETKYPGIRFTDSVHSSFHYARIMAPIWYSGVVGLSLQAVNYNNQGEALTPATIYIQSLKDNTSSIWFDATTLRLGTSTCDTAIYSANAYLGSYNFSGPNDLFAVGNKIQVNGTNSSYYNNHQLLLMICENGLRLVDASQSGWPTVWTIAPDSNGFLKFSSGSAHRPTS